MELFVNIYFYEFILCLVRVLVICCFCLYQLSYGIEVNLAFVYSS